MKFLTKISAAMIFVAADLLLLFTIIYGVILNPTFLMWRYTAKYHAAEKLHVEEVELRQITGTVVSLMKGKSDDFTFGAVVRGEEVQFLNPKEIVHMQEIVELLGDVKIFLTVCVLLAVFALILIIVNSRKGKNPKKYIAKCLSGGFMLAQGFILLAGGLVFGAAALNLKAWVVWVHKVFMKNGSWVLNPVTDRLIYLCPTGLFADGIILVSVVFVVYILAGICYFFVNYFKERDCK